MSNKKEISRIFEEIETKSLTNDFVYRGEPEDYGKVSSNLYRQYQVEIDGEGFDIDIDTVHKEIENEASEYTNHSDKDVLMAELQHYGGKTNFIDFTKDYRIALFFACNGSPDKKGRVILKEKYTTEEYRVYEPPSPENRIIAQKSFFIYPIKGWLDWQESEIISIPAKLKENLLKNLNKFYGISAVTIYNDLHGFIKNKQIHEKSYTEFYTGVAFFNKAQQEQNLDERKNYLEKSIFHFGESINHNPQNITSYINRGVARNKIGKYQGAISDYNKAMELNPKLAEPYNGRGIVYMELNKSEEAFEDFNKAIELDPEHFKVYNSRGVLNCKLEKYQEAMDDYTKAIELNPQSAEAYNNRGNVKLFLKQYIEAIDDYDNAIKLKPKNSESYYRRGSAKKELHDQTAKQDFAQAIFLAKEQGNSAVEKAAQHALDELEKSKKTPPKKD